MLENIYKYKFLIIRPIYWALSLIFVFWYFYNASDTSISPRDFGIGIATFALPLLLDRLTAALENHVDKTHRDEQFSRLEEISRASSGYETRSVDEAVEYIKTRLDTAIQIKNTFISFRDSSPNTEARNRRIISLYETFFKSGGTHWHDIVSIEEMFGSRYSLMDSISVNSGSFEVSLIRHNIPVVNFCIISHRNARKDEVLFGWLYRDDKDAQNIYLSNDENIVRTFKRYFEMLHQFNVANTTVELNAERISTSKSSIDFVDKAGRWLTVGTLNGQTVSCGLIDISFDARCVSIKGAVRWSDNDKRVGTQRKWRVEPANHSAPDTAYTKDRIYLNFERLPGRYGGGTNGICVYSFKKVSGIETMSGDIHETGHSEVIRIIGRKLDTDPSPSGEITQDTIKSYRAEYERLARNSGPELEWEKFGWEKG